MLLIEPGRAPRIDHAVVATVLELTLAESRIAVWLAEGRTVREIAVTLGLQDNTLYYHQKQRLSRQVDLVRLVLSLAEVT